jgi:hypothetical protein
LAFHVGLGRSWRMAARSQALLDSAYQGPGCQRLKLRASTEVRESWFERKGRIVNNRSIVSNKDYSRRDSTPVPGRIDIDANEEQ